MVIREKKKNKNTEHSIILAISDFKVLIYLNDSAILPKMKGSLDQVAHWLQLMCSL